MALKVAWPDEQLMATTAAVTEVLGASPLTREELGGAVAEVAGDGAPVKVTWVDSLH